MGIKQFIETQIVWSKKTFGEGANTERLCRHIEKELAEIRKDPNSVVEWIDVAILALDGAWRRATYRQEHPPSRVAPIVVGLLWEKARENWLLREGPKEQREGEPVEHVRPRCPSCCSAYDHRTRGGGWNGWNPIGECKFAPGLEYRFRDVPEAYVLPRDLEFRTSGAGAWVAGTLCRFDPRYVYRFREAPCAND